MDRRLMTRMSRHLLVWSVTLLLTAVLAQAAAAAPKPTLVPADPGAARDAAKGSGVLRAPRDFADLTGVRVSPLLFAAPASYDLRSLDRVTPVKDQGPFGTCWAFATFASLESCLLPGETWDFSEDSLARYHGFDTDGYNGGQYLQSGACLLRWQGPFSEAQDPYYDGLHPDPATLAEQKHVQDVLYLAPRASSSDNDDLKWAVMTYGGVATSMYMNESGFNAATDAYYEPSTMTQNHGVTIVGWDDAYPVANFAPAPPGAGAFLVKNSWSTAWGDQGYFWISYYDAVLAYDLNAVFSRADDPAAYDVNYQYDPLGYIGQVGYGYGTTTAWMANRFTAQSDGSLEAAGFYTLAPDASYEIYTGSSLTSRQLRASGTLPTYGFHTVEFDSPVALTSGQQFYVIVKLTTPGEDYGVAYEYRAPDYSSAATASPGQSYMSPDGSSWQDLTGFDDTANVCLKAYAAAGGPPPPVPPVVSQPNGGETWTIGDSRSVTWTGGGSGPATIDLSRDGGVTWPETLADGTANDGSFTWTVSGPATAQARVRVTTGEGADTSNASFTIAEAPSAPWEWVAQVSTVDVWLEDVWSATPGTAWAAGDAGTLVRTSHGGDPWLAQPSGVSADLYGVAFADASRGCAVGDDGVIVATRDGGDTWTLRPSGTEWPLDDVDFGSGPIGWAVGLGGVFKTSDGGWTWTAQRSGLADVGRLQAVDFVDRWQGWAVGADGAIVHTADGGLSWRRQSSGVTVDLEGVSFANSTLGIAVGASATVLRTSDGGLTWRTVEAPTGADLKGVALTGAEIGYAAGYYGALLGTDDGGATWRAIDVGGSPWFRSVSCARERIAFAAGLDGDVFACIQGSGDQQPPHTDLSGIDDLWHRTGQAGSLVASDLGGGAVAGTRYRVDGAGWRDGNAVSVPAQSGVSAVHRVDFYSTDGANAESYHSVDVRIDARRPVTSAPSSASVRRGGTVSLKYKVADGKPCAPRAMVTIRVKTLKGRTVKTLSLGSRAVNATLTYRWRCTLAKGTYKYHVYAKDAAGNTQSRVGANRLTVR